MFKILKKCLLNDSGYELKKWLSEINKGLATKFISLNSIDYINKLLFSVIDEKDKLYSLFKNMGSKGHSIISHKLVNYVNNGFFGLLTYELKKRKIDTAMREVTSLIFNTLKYEYVKYLGLFDLIYQYLITEKDSIELDQVSGLSGLMSFLEYETFGEKARKASDYGVPYYVLSSFEKESVNLDEYEKRSRRFFKWVIIMYLNIHF